MTFAHIKIQFSKAYAIFSFLCVFEVAVVKLESSLINVFLFHNFTNLSLIDSGLCCVSLIIVHHLLYFCSLQIKCNEVPETFD